jgi:hypothetical protein
MSQKAHSVSHPEGQQPAGHAEPSFASLPEPVVAQIAQLSKQPRWERGHPLLRVSRSCRDAVLSSLTAVKLFTSPVSSPASKAFSPGLCARLLHRACCQARPGLKLRLHLEKNCDSLPHLLQPGVECGGWRSVHKLEVGFKQGGTNCGRLPEPSYSIRQVLMLTAAGVAGLQCCTLSSCRHSGLPSLDTAEAEPS